MEEFNRDLIVTMKDVRGAKQCSRGACAWSKANNLDWHSFLKNGITCGELIDTGDVMALQVVRFAHEQKTNGRL